MGITTLTQDLFGLPPTATLAEVLAAPLKLKALPARELSEKKVESLAEKFATIPRQYQNYYPQPKNKKLLPPQTVAEEVEEVKEALTEPPPAAPPPPPRARDLNAERERGEAPPAEEPPGERNMLASKGENDKSLRVPAARLEEGGIGGVARRRVGDTARGRPKLYPGAKGSVGALRCPYTLNVE